MSPTPTPRQPIADTSAASAATIRFETYDILQSDGTPVGTIMTNGLTSAAPSPPGPPLGAMNFAIVGGTGAFLGSRGQAGKIPGNSYCRKLCLRSTSAISAFFIQVP